ncbi:MAG: hypothetical protein H7Y05_10190 [Steroidobacteraceae bacterium]|nr:hypothetical protein [Deltaproteobacteria bacterium]
MKARHPRTTSSIAAIPILVSVLISLLATPVWAETELFLRSAVPLSASSSGNALPALQKLRMKLDEKGDFLIQCGCARFIVAYNSPADQFKPAEQQRKPQREENSAINGFSVVASVSF